MRFIPIALTVTLLLGSPIVHADLYEDMVQAVKK